MLIFPYSNINININIILCSKLVHYLLWTCAMQKTDCFEGYVLLYQVLIREKNVFY